MYSFTTPPPSNVVSLWETLNAICNQVAVILYRLPQEKSGEISYHLTLVCTCSDSLYFIMMSGLYVANCLKCLELTFRCGMQTPGRPVQVKELTESTDRVCYRNTC